MSGDADTVFFSFMTLRAMSSRHAIDSCTLQFHAWKPLHLQTLAADPSSPRPSYAFHSKKPCRSDRSTAPYVSLDISRLTLLDDSPPPTHPPPPLLNPARHEDGVRWFHRKRRRRGSRSVSGRSSDRSGTLRRGGASGAYATCSDFPLAPGGTDSSGELFVDGDGNWGSDVSDAARLTRKEGKDIAGGGLEKDGPASGVFQAAIPEFHGSESGYGSEPGYRGDGELGYGDELDEEDEDVRPLFWSEEIGDTDQMEIVGEDSFSEQKSHHRCRRKKHDGRIITSSR